MVRDAVDDGAHSVLGDRVANGVPAPRSVPDRGTKSASSDNSGIPAPDARGGAVADASDGQGGRGEALPFWQARAGLVCHGRPCPAVRSTSQEHGGTRPAVAQLCVAGLGTRRAPRAAKSVDAARAVVYKRGVMERMPHPAVVWTANVLVPGAGLVLAGRLLVGGVVALGWAVVLGTLVLGTLVWPDEAGSAAVSVSAVGVVLLFLLAQGLLWVRERSLRRYRESEERDEQFREVLAATLQGRLDDAEAACRRLLARDPDDVEAALHLATLARRRGDARDARSWLDRASFLDDAGRWDFQIERERAAVAAEAGEAGY